MSGRLIDLTGQHFGRLTVIARGGSDKRWHARWVCECTCGTTTLVQGGNLRSGNSQSCGCLKKEALAKQVRSNTTHGMSGTREYKVYAQAKRRCQNSNDPAYADYGGRGIQFRFKNFKEFFGELGGCPPGMTLERVDNHGHYERGNDGPKTQTVLGCRVPSLRSTDKEVQQCSPKPHLSAT